MAADKGEIGAGVGDTNGAFVGGGPVGALVGEPVVGDRVGEGVAGMQQLSLPTLRTVAQSAVPVMYVANEAASPHVVIKLLKSDGTASFASMFTPAQNGQELDDWTSEQQKAE